MITLDLNESYCMYDWFFAEVFDGHLEVLNRAPEKPDLTGDTEGDVGEDLTFIAVTTDPDGHNIMYGFDWDDGNPIEWTNLEDSGIPVEITHAWDEVGEYNISVIAEDEYGAQSAWSDSITVTIIGIMPEFDIERFSGSVLYSLFV